MGETRLAPDPRMVALYEALENAAEALKITADFLEETEGFGGTAQGVRNDERRAREALAKARGTP